MILHRLFCYDFHWQIKQLIIENITSSNIEIKIKAKKDELLLLYIKIDDHTNQK